MIKKVISLVLIILFITLTPISSFLQIENCAYAVTTFEQDLDSEMFKQLIIPTLISAGLVFSSKESAEKAVSDTIDWLKQQGFDFQNPNDPEGPKLGDVIKTMLKGTIVVSAANGIYKNVVEINDMFWDLIKTFVDEKYDVGENNITEPINYENELSQSPDYGLHIVSTLQPNETYKFKYKVTFKNDTWIYQNEVTQESIAFNEILYLGYKIKLGVPNDTIEIGSFKSDATAHQIASVTYKQVDTVKVDFIKSSAVGYPNYVAETYSIFGTSGYVDNPSYDWVNTQTQEREVVIPIMPDETGLAPKKDENETLVPGIGTDDWIGVTPEEIPNLDPDGMPYTPPEITPENPLPVNPELPENPTLEQIQDFTIIEYLKNIFQTNKNAAEMQDPTIMGIPSADGTGNGGTGTPTAFDWGDFSKFFDIFFIFIYFIVILILILLKFLKVVFSNLPNIPANTDLFTEYPTILDGVNYIKNLRVGGMSVTVQQAFEYVFLIFFFIFVLKQLRKLYGAYVQEEHERDRDNKKDMKLDYYDNNYKYKDNNHENIKFKGWD